LARRIPHSGRFNSYQAARWIDNQVPLRREKQRKAMRAPQIIPPAPGVPSPSRAWVERQLALAVVMGGQWRILLRLTMRENRITEVQAIADAERLGQFDLTVLT
jgi:hypothetical protein